MGEQNSTCGAASNEITSTLQKNPWKSWIDHSSEFMELCNISNPASDGEEVQEARDQVGAQHLTFAVLAALIGFHVVNVLLLGYQLTGSRGTRICICTSSFKP